MKTALIVAAAVVALAAAAYAVVWPVSGLGLENDWRCDLRRGQMVATGCGIAGCNFECARVYSDGGKECSSSEDCRGKCLVYGSLFDGEPPSGPGRCAETDLIENCASAYELMADGSVKSVGSCNL